MTDPVTDPNENSVLPPADSAGPVPTDRQNQEPAVTKAQQDQGQDENTPDSNAGTTQLYLEQDVLIKAFTVDDVTITQKPTAVPSDKVDTILEAARDNGVSVKVKE
jgi:hypothetical protein